MQKLGQTRSANRGDHLLQTPDTFVRTPLPGLTAGAAIVHAAPAAGAGFAMYTVEFEGGGVLQGAGAAQRFVYVLEGSVELRAADATHPLRPGGFAYLPPLSTHEIHAEAEARVCVIEKLYVPVDGVAAPEMLIGRESAAASSALMGDDGLQVRSLLPAHLGFDFAVNTMTYQPGASLAMVEVHVMEHGVLMLEGGGIYRLSEAWYPTAAGDFIWMGPFCPQWFGALGKVPAKYLIYKDWNRCPLS